MLFLLFFCWLSICMATFVVYSFDKIMAKYGRWRVPESLLLSLAIFGGAMGALMSMTLFRHKTQKNIFRVTLPLVFIGQIAMALWLLYLWFIQI